MSKQDSPSALATCRMGKRPSLSKMAIKVFTEEVILGQFSPTAQENAPWQKVVCAMAKKVLEKDIKRKRRHPCWRRTI